MMPKVSAIVSLYNAERFVRSRLDSLFSQTLYQRGELEVVVVNAGSRQGERYICREYLDKIVYIETLREPIYQSWNRGIAIATGEFVTNANADDAFTCPDALEIMAAALDNNPGVGLVYCDSLVVGEDGKPSVKPPYNGRIAWPEFDARALLRSYYGGPSPMWRRELHERYGLFDDNYQLASDYEFALRIVANGVVFKHIPQTLTSFFDNGTGINNPDQSAMESRRAALRYKDKINGTM